MKNKYRILPILADLIPAIFYACDGILFDSLTSCPHCRGGIADYDVKTKHFAVVADGSSTKTITVRVKRFQCRECHAVVYAHQPFYPETRIGSPVVDLCITFASIMPYSSASTFLYKIGIIVDRWSVRNYAMKNTQSIATTGVYGIPLPVSIVTLAALTTDAGEDSRLNPSDVLSACGYPSLKKGECNRTAR
ncbi:MAG: hypothetical protein PHF57_00970 [Methanoregula sp.]|nr:hypothetical protein [Methanoregula sp.]MDD5023545.1 hypothetical protein [Methanoregula sp.]MDD5186762.1 hypothetical protein [Methanoregula sp.]